MMVQYWVKIGRMGMIKIGRMGMMWGVGVGVGSFNC